MIRRDELKEVDFLLLGTVFFILCIGLLSLYSASYHKGELIGRNFAFLQFKWVIVGLAGLLIAANINYHKFIGVSYILYGINVLLLVLVLLFGEGRLGAHRWFRIGPLGSFQPSEFAKLVLLLALANFLSHNPPRNAQDERKKIIVSFLLICPPMWLILMQPDLGTALIFIPLLLSMLYVWRIRIRYLLSIVFVGLLSTPLIWFLLKDYQRERLLVFINPNVDPLGAGYTLLQSKIAIGSGGIFGKGWLGGTQNKLRFLPEGHTDFIFSIIGEEWGLLGGVIILLLYFLFLLRMLGIARNTRDPSARLMATGIFTIFLFHIFVNVSMTMGLAPVVGLPLPFMSYGGSNLLVGFVLVGLLMNIRMRRPMF